MIAERGVENIGNSGAIMLNAALENCLCGVLGKVVDFVLGLRCKVRKNERLCFFAQKVVFHVNRGVEK